MLDTQTLNRPQHFRHTDIHTDTHCRLVVGAGQRFVQRYPPVTGPIIVLRCPGFAWLCLQRHRRVFDQRRQRVLLRLLQRREINRRLDQGADRTRRIQRTIETGVARVSTSDQRQHFTGLGTGDHHRCFNGNVALGWPQAFDRILYGLLGLVLQ